MLDRIVAKRVQRLLRKCEGETVGRVPANRRVWWAIRSSRGLRAGCCFMGTYALKGIVSLIQQNADSLGVSKRLVVRGLTVWANERGMDSADLAERQAF